MGTDRKRGVLGAGREAAWAGALAVGAAVVLAGAGRDDPASPAPSTPASAAQAPKPELSRDVPPGLPKGPTWGRGSFQPTAANSVFATGDGCALCHSASEKAGALWSATGEDVSPHGLWKGTMMAHSAKDPYWRAQVAKETSRHPERAAELEALCVRCHAPMGHHTNLIAGERPPRVAEVVGHALYSDGVSCTVCHQVRPDGLGTPERFEGNVLISPGRTIYGPFADPGGQPMKMHSAFTPTLGEHVRSAGLCAGCHTLRTGHEASAAVHGGGHENAGGGGEGGLFPEQSPYFEWRNSVYSDEPAPSGAGRTAQSRTCQECHMPEVRPMRIARNPAGLDFNIKTRSPVRAHAFVGGNAFMLDLIRANAGELGVTAPPESLERTARATRAQLSHATATIGVEGLRRAENPDGSETAVFDVVVTNLTGHKFPTGYPARRAWLNVSVRAGNRALFDSGVLTKEGKLKGVEDELGLPHRDVVEEPSQVVVYEMVGATADGRPTTYLSDMVKKFKDTRLLPAGYRADGPHAEDTRPVGTDGDANFAAGGDRVTYRVKLPAGTAGRLVVVARLLYQPVPPAWVEPLRTLDAPEARAFVRMYDAAVPRPEQIAVTVEVEKGGGAEE